MITLTIPGEPMGKQRARVVRSRAGFPVAYTPAKTKNYETLVRELFATEHPDFEPLHGPIYMLVYSYHSIPKSTSKKKASEMAKHIIRPTKKPDGDNIWKICADSLTGLAFLDDANIVCGKFYKWYARKPRVTIVIGEVSNDQSV